MTKLASFFKRFTFQLEAYRLGVMLLFQHTEGAEWKLLLTLTILQSKTTKIFNGDHLIGQAPRAFYRAIKRSARSLRRGAKTGS